MTGIVQKNRRGFGFLLQEEGEDVFLSPRHLGGAMSGDRYLYEPDLYRLVGNETKRTFTLGDKVRIRVAGASIRDREIDFILDESTLRLDPDSRKKGKRA